MLTNIDVDMSITDVSGQMNAPSIGFIDKENEFLWVSWWALEYGTGQEAKGSTWSSGGSFWKSWNTFSLWVWPSTGIGCPWRLWCIHPGKYSKAYWTWSWAMGSRWPCLIRGIGLDHHQKSLPSSTTLWVC